jgi:hypothetical protein
MPDRETLERAQEDARQGKSPSTQAGEFVREEIHHIREGKHGARSPQQAIAIGLSEARRAGVKLSPPKGPAAVRKKAAQDTAARRKAKGSLRKTKTSAKRSRASEAALKRESRSAASHEALSRQAKKSAVKRGKQSRRQAAIKAARTRKAA